MNVEEPERARKQRQPQNHLQGRIPLIHKQFHAGVWGATGRDRLTTPRNARILLEVNRWYTRAMSLGLAWRCFSRRRAWSPCVNLACSPASRRQWRAVAPCTTAACTPARAIPAVMTEIAASTTPRRQLLSRWCEARSRLRRCLSEICEWQTWLRCCIQLRVRSRRTACILMNRRPRSPYGTRATAA